MPKGLGWAGVVGPGVIVLGMSIGSGEFLLGPAAFVNMGSSALDYDSCGFPSDIFQLRVDAIHAGYGRAGITGFMRTRPNSSFWAWFYVLLYFLQMGWPAWAGNAAAAMFMLATQRLPESADSNVVYAIGAGKFLLCVSFPPVGRRIERTLELLNWVLIIVILGGSWCWLFCSQARNVAGGRRRVCWL